MLSEYNPANGQSWVGRLIYSDPPQPRHTLSSLGRPSERPQAHPPEEPSRPSSAPAVVRSDDSDSSDDGVFESGDLDPGFQSAGAGSTEPVDPMVVEPVGVQLPQADVVHETRPGLFDYLAPEFLSDAHRALDAWPHAGDRMLVSYRLPVSRTAQAVAGALLWHGWASYPSRDRISAMTGIAGLGNISRAQKELEEAGIIARRKRVKSGRGYAGNTIVFNGHLVCEILAGSLDVKMAALAQEVLSLESEAGGSDEGRSINQISRGGQDGESRGINEILRGGENGQTRGINQIPRVGASDEESVARSINQIPPGVSTRYQNHDDDLIDNNIEIINQSSNQVPGYRGINQIPRVGAEVEGRGVNLTPRGTAGLECAACGSNELNGGVCSDCGVLVQWPDDSSAWPAWYKGLAEGVPRENLPEWEELREAQLVAGWSVDVLRRASDRYIDRYAGQHVTAPFNLFHAVAVSIASERVQSGRGGGGSVSGARQSGGPRDPGPSVCEQSAPAQAVCTCEEIAAAAASVPDPEAQAMWAKVLHVLSLELPATTFDAWLKDSEGVRREGENLLVRVASVFTIAWIEERVYQSVLRALRECCGPTWDVHFEVLERAICRVHGIAGSN